MAGFIKRWIVPAIMYTTLYSISLFYGVLFSLRILYRWAKEKDAFWKVKKRDIPPECLNDPVYGNHAYIQIKVNNKRFNWVYFIHDTLISQSYCLCVNEHLVINYDSYLLTV